MNIKNPLRIFEFSFLEKRKVFQEGVPSYQRHEVPGEKLVSKEKAADAKKSMDELMGVDYERLDRLGGGHILHSRDGNSYEIQISHGIDYRSIRNISIAVSMFKDGQRTDVNGADVSTFWKTVDVDSTRNPDLEGKHISNYAFERVSYNDGPLDIESDYRMELNFIKDIRVLYVPGSVQPLPLNVSVEEAVREIDDEAQKTRKLLLELETQLPR